jgi:diacylglycerol kinase (ATP)
MRILMLSNGSSGTPRRRSRAEALAARLRAGGASVDSDEPESAELMRERAAAARKSRHEVVLVAGGDGTLHAVVNGLVQVPKQERPALAILPVGRGNDFAAEIGLVTPDDTLRSLTSGRRRFVDLGKSEAGVFLGVASAGFDARVARRAQETPFLSGSLLYSFAVLRTLVDFEPLEVRLRFESGTYDGPLVFAAVGNASRYGGGMRIAPEARLDDGLLDLCLVLPVSRRTLLAVFPSVFRGKHLAHPKVRYHRSPFVELATEEPAEVFADGEPLQKTPIRIETLASELEVLVSR